MMSSRVARELAADAVALSKEHADRADALDARWQAIKGYLAGEVRHYDTITDDIEPEHIAALAMSRCARDAHERTLAKMRELEG